ncbi:excalibur calcium-binding domain-containing protein [Mumia sp. zg.B53]|uniref:excalibur calcium-binding domain-containing protein n=1 Tax=Mumia sp. zg.B53 TaxID=2855449 RepID=UPI001C6F0D80|nr:excalibur calcium-binding domain-containing protein [Mumia sp. zg.B53]MBW9213255.1 excalibur calcium-binding domain-containing protein [Mumia sp. zg.B53]
MSGNDSPRPLPPPGWYRSGDALRWWDGLRWTDRTEPLRKDVASTGDERSGKSKTLPVAIVVGLVAFVLGIGLGAGSSTDPDVAASKPSATPPPTSAATTPPATTSPQTTALTARLKAKTAQVSAQERRLAQRAASLKTLEAKLAKKAASLRARVTEVRSREQAVASAEATRGDDAGDVGIDPLFGTCGEANDNGYGSYEAGVDPEYSHYDDRDNDGVVCEY